MSRLLQAHKDEAQYKQNAGRNITFVRIPCRPLRRCCSHRSRLGCDQAVWENTEDSDSLFVAMKRSSIHSYRFAQKRCRNRRE